MFKHLLLVGLAASLLPTTALAQASEGRLTSTAKREVRTCLNDADRDGWEIESSVSTVSTCFAGGFIREVNFYSSYICRPNQICPRVADFLVATVTFGCDDNIIEARCCANTCLDDASCDATSWCRQTEFGYNECTPYVGEGDTCGGYVLPWYYERCEPGLVCTTDPMIPDLQGECATCDYNGTGYAAGESFPSDDGCNTCFCGEDGLVGCTKRLCAE